MQGHFSCHLAHLRLSHTTTPKARGATLRVGVVEEIVQRDGAARGVRVSGDVIDADAVVLTGKDKGRVVGLKTVQQRFALSNGGALKLTIAQYLTPGGISIQGVGVTPDIELDPMTIDPLELDLYRTETRLVLATLIRLLGSFDLA